ncbi:MAG: 4Fe-4S dicluster domain-containing protein [Anaerolineae bacterium]
MSDPIELVEDIGSSAPSGGLSRREFVRQVGAGFVALAAVGVGGVNLFRAAPVELPLSSGVISPDPSLCIGCLTCEVACSQAHREQGLSDIPRIRIFNHEATVPNTDLVAAFGERGHFRQSPCLMCPDAPCHHVCPADALPIEVTSGARIIDENKCIACGRCAAACPFPVSPESLATNGEGLGQKTRITYDPAKNVYTKCDLCYWRAEGPACAERCPVNVRIRQGILKSDHLCLEVPGATRQHWEQQSTLDQQA